MKRVILLSNLLMLFLTAGILSQEKLYVFYPSTVRPQAMQERLATAFGDVSVTVFGRYNDFTSKIGTEPPDAVITKPVLIDQIGGYTPVLKAERQGKTDDSYVLMSINTPLDVAAVTAETAIGVIDVLGRGGMKLFAEQIFPVEPKLKRVTKVEDLLPLLSFNMASGILVEDVFVKYFRATSQLQFRVTPLGKATGGILTLAVRNGGKADKIITTLKKNGRDVGDVFEVELWK